MSDVRKQFDAALNYEGFWRRKMSSMDKGSYCEKAEPDAEAATKIVSLLRQLQDALLAWERTHHD